MASKIFKRKLIQTSGYSYTVVLPKAWIDLHNLEKAYAVDMEIRSNGALVIKPEGHYE